MEAGQIWVAEHNIVALKKMLEQVRKTSWVSARVLASLLGKIIFVACMLCLNQGSRGGSYSSFPQRLVQSLLFGLQVWSSIIPSPFGIPHLQSRWSIRMLVTPVLAAMWLSMMGVTHG